MLKNMQLTVQAKGQQMPGAWLGQGVWAVSEAVPPAVPTWGHVPLSHWHGGLVPPRAVWAQQQQGALKGLLWLQSCVGGSGTLQPRQQQIQSIAEPAQIPAWH